MKIDKLFETAAVVNKLSTLLTDFVSSADSEQITASDKGKDAKLQGY